MLALFVTCGLKAIANSWIHCSLLPVRECFSLSLSPAARAFVWAGTTWQPRPARLCFEPQARLPVAHVAEAWPGIAAESLTIILAAIFSRLCRPARPELGPNFFLPARPGPAHTWYGMGG